MNTCRQFLKQAGAASVTLFILATFLCAFFAQPLFASPSLMVTGWDSPNAGQFRQHVAEFEKLGMVGRTNIDPNKILFL